MSEPSAITGLPEPHVATHAVGMPDTPRCTLKPCFSSRPVRYFDVSTSWKPSSPKLKTESTISCAIFASLVHAPGGVGLVGRQPGVGGLGNAGAVDSTSATQAITANRARIIVGFLLKRDEEIVSPSACR